MKALLAFLLLSPCLLLAEEPQQTAVRHLQAIRDGSVNLDPGGATALSKQTSETKRKEILKRLQRMALDISREPLVVGTSRIEGDLAAVLIRQSVGFDLDAFRVFPVALVRRSGSWRPTPLPSSFQNSGISYDPATRTRAKMLEDWMIEQVPVELKTLRGEAMEQVRREIGKSLSPEVLRTIDSKSCAERFLKACSENDFPTMAGLMGGASPTLPNNWNQRLKAADFAVKTDKNLPRPWKLLMSSDVLRISLDHHQSGNKAHLILACMDPDGVPPRFEKPELEQITLNLTKSSDGPWTVDLPDAFLTSARKPADELLPTPLNEDRMDMLRQRLDSLYPCMAEKDPRMARDRLLESFRSCNSLEWIRRFQHTAEGENPDSLLGKAVAIRRAFDQTRGLRYCLPLGEHDEEGRFASVFQIFSLVSPDRFELQTLYFIRTPDGWAWTPSPNEETTSVFDSWKNSHQRKWEEQWRNTLLDECAFLKEIPNSGAPPEAEAESLIKRWFQAIQEGDIRAALRLTARLNLPDSGATLLRNLAYEIQAARKHGNRPELGIVLSSNPWTLVTLRPIEGSPGKNTDGNPCFPVIQTPDGPRILLETDLLESGTRTRQYLNKMSIKRLEKFNREIAQTLKELFSKHCEETLPPVKQGD